MGVELRLLVLLLLQLLTGVVPAAITVETGEKTGLRTWLWTHEGVSLRLVQRLPDQTRAYLQARGFAVKTADAIATTCFFGSMFRNDGVLPLDFDLNTWKVVQKGKETPLFVREYWKKRLQPLIVTKAARIALNWSLMPSQQHFEPGDYNWGMTVYGLPPGEHFDLQLQLRLGEQTVKAIIPDLQCAPEQLK
jgi:hypothetical protein